MTWVDFQWIESGIVGIWSRKVHAKPWRDSKCFFKHLSKWQMDTFDFKIVSGVFLTELTRICNGFFEHDKWYIGYSSILFLLIASLSITKCLFSKREKAYVLLKKDLKTPILFRKIPLETKTKFVFSLPLLLPFFSFLLKQRFSLHRAILNHLGSSYNLLRWIMIYVSRLTVKQTGRRKHWIALRPPWAHSLTLPPGWIIKWNYLHVVPLKQAFFDHGSNHYSLKYNFIFIRWISYSRERKVLLFTYILWFPCKFSNIYYFEYIRYINYSRRIRWLSKRTFSEFWVS